jgi:HJR/Mrr/RecB family endonuclease
VPHFNGIDTPPFVIDWLRTDPARMAQLSPAQFEHLVANRLCADNYAVLTTGHTYQGDGGIDLFAVKRSGEFPGVVAVQVKHSRCNNHVGPQVIREFDAVVSRRGFNAGIIVTNTHFTPEARWLAHERGALMQLRDFNALCRWLQNQFGGDDVYDELPRFVRLGKRLKISVPRPHQVAPDGTPSE